VEKHFTGSQTIRDMVIGISDGLLIGGGLAAAAAFSIAKLIS
jgi:hypothetical protein